MQQTCYLSIKYVEYIWTNGILKAIILLLAVTK